jgi:hypothetical protein
MWQHLYFYSRDVHFISVPLSVSANINVMAAVARSGLQTDVLKLYRMLLRTAKAKDPTSPHCFVTFVRQEFRKSAATVKRTEIKRIEHLIRQGMKQKKLIEMPGFRNNFGPKSS